jgi:hypothetical protein
MSEKRTPKPSPLAGEGAEPGRPSPARGEGDGARGAGEGKDVERR